MSQQKIEIYYNDNGDPQLEVVLENETVWLTQKQMSDVFGTTPENILMHLKNIFNDQELQELATTKDFLVVRQEGKREVKRTLKHYELKAQLIARGEATDLFANPRGDGLDSILVILINRFSVSLRNQQLKAKRHIYCILW